jgi:Tol biopolymer transport system component
LELAAGRALLHYRLLEKIGAGGMGEVWRARDTTLDRDVAIKFLPAEFAGDVQRLARFEHEAKVLASLNHTNIASIYGLHECEGHRFLAMELVGGEDLAQQLLRGPLPLREALDVARQVTAGLESAHGGGVVHRDLKPANVQRSPEGSVKILDFGLAKALESAHGDARQSTTVTSVGSIPGKILGTASYMSPEQARGQMIDRRTDLWAFGCLLYEMLSGKKAFDGSTITDILAAVVTRDPDWDALPADTPTPVRRLLRRCLEKDVRKRLRDAGDANLLLEDNPEDARSSTFVPTPSAAIVPAWKRSLPWGMVLVLAVGLAGTLAMRAGPKPAPAPPRIFSAKLPPDTKLDIETNQGEYPILAISRDGSKIAFVAVGAEGRRLYLRATDKLAAAPIPGTELGVAPFFSPDGRWIGFFASGKLEKVSVDGGEAIELCDAGLSRGGVWCDDDSIVFSPGTTGGLMRVPSGGGKPVALTTLDAGALERTHRWPALLPNGEIAFTVGAADKPGAYEDARIDAVSLATGKRRTLVVGASMARYAASGHLVLARDNQLFAIRLTDATGGPLGSAQPVVQGVDGVVSSGAVFFDIAGDGTLVYVERDAKAKELALVRVGKDGRAAPLALPPREYRGPRVSPDGRRIVVGIGPGRGRASDVWIGDLVHGEMTRLTTDGLSSSPIWTRDGRRIAFGASAPGGGDSLVWRSADGTDPESVLASFSDSSARAPLSWSPDGTYLVYQQSAGAGRTEDVMMLSVADRQSRPVVATPAVEMGGILSPNGKWIAYVSDESGRFEVYVQSFPRPQGRWQLSSGGVGPVWSTDGKSLYYIAADVKMMEVPVDAGDTFSHGTPRALFDTRFPPDSDTFTNYDVTADGGFVMVQTSSEMRTAEHVNVVENFFGMLRRTAP